ncbi:hypothetical protein HLH89_33055 [Rhizobium laguerreae]|uniref:hypothetical protein n=1 Tax=Rhizobium laguerreae TaxID=1076926 RepID=UPI00147936AC|nr:hypothetical protein [Rhizobium laguerreae]NNH85782.1 hypothetical protein [Rhizobium laguerreae]
MSDRTTDQAGHCPFPQGPTIYGDLRPDRLVPPVNAFEVVSETPQLVDEYRS